MQIPQRPFHGYQIIDPQNLSQKNNAVLVNLQPGCYREPIHPQYIKDCRARASSTASLSAIPAHQIVNALFPGRYETEPPVKRQRRVELLDMDRDRLAGQGGLVEQIAQ
jgi:hypothetical protein